MCDVLDSAEKKGLDRYFLRGYMQAVQETHLEHIKALIQNLGLTAEASMDALDIPEADRGKYLDMLQKSLEERKRLYKDKVTTELIRRGVSETNVQKVIAKTGFYDALEKFPEEQMRESISGTVDEILVIAASN